MAVRRRPDPDGLVGVTRDGRFKLRATPARGVIAAAAPQAGARQARRNPEMWWARSKPSKSRSRRPRAGEERCDGRVMNAVTGGVIDSGPRGDGRCDGQRGCTYTLCLPEGDRSMAHAYRRLALCPLLAVVALLVAGDRPASAGWRRLDSPNFVVVGDAGEGALRDVAVKFEGFRETLSRVLTDRVTATAVPTVVIVFPSDKAFTPFKPTFEGKPIELAGLFVPRADVNYIAVASTGGEESMRVVFHEYAHLVISNVGRNIPVWLNEGLAEFYSTYRVGAGGKEAVLGAAVPSHLVLLNDATLVPLPQLLAVTPESPMYNEGSRRSVFYAQSWALTHMLLLGEPRRSPQLGQFLSLVGQGIPAASAWERAFAGEPIERDLNAYVRRRLFNAYKYKFTEKTADIQAAAVPLAAADAEAFLADFLVQQGRHGEAAARLAKPGGSGPTTAWAATVGAEVDLAKAAYDAAEKRLLGVDATTDWLTGYRASVALADLVDARGRAPEAAHVAAARRFVEAARAAGHETPNAVARLAALELAAHEPPSAATAAALERARALAPGRLDYAFLHARVLVAQSAFLPARNVVAPLMSPVYPPDIRDSARSLMSYILRLEAARAAGSPGAAEAAPALPATASGTRPPESSTDTATPFAAGAGEKGRRSSPPVVMPVFREPGPGERRLEGVLERIECQAAVATTFHVRAGESVVRVTAPRMDAVDFITYRDDLKGRVGCGPLRDPARVYVTWRPGAEPSARIAVAIEFLPK